MTDSSQPTHGAGRGERSTMKRMSAARKRRVAWWSVFAIVALAVGLPLASYALHALGVGEGAGAAQAQTVEGVDLRQNSRSDYWRAVNGGVGGYSAVKGAGANVLIERGGTNWQALRNGPVTTILPWSILAVALVLLVYHLVFGRNTLEKTPSGAKIKRWSWFERAVHWTVAVSFIVLAVTGLSMLVGRAVLIPLLGKAGFAFWAQTSMTLHNVVGPIFSIGIVLMIVLWVWHNFPEKGDWQWLKEGGGMFSEDKHPPAGRMNAGEKLWFWLVASVGVLVCVTGFVLVAPIFGITLPFVDGLRPEMRGASIVHAVLAIGWTAAALGHVYIGTAGTEGAFEGMSTGYVSAEWAEQHHDRWYAEMAEQGEVIPPGVDLDKSPGAAPRTVPVG